MAERIKRGALRVRAVISGRGFTQKLKKNTGIIKSQALLWLGNFKTARTSRKTDGKRTLMPTETVTHNAGNLKRFLDGGGRVGGKFGRGPHSKRFLAVQSRRGSNRKIRRHLKWCEHKLRAGHKGQSGGAGRQGYKKMGGGGEGPQQRIPYV